MTFSSDKVSPEDVEVTISQAQPDTDIASLLQDAVANLLAAFEDKVAYDKGKEDQIARLHTELQEYKSDLLSRAVHPYVAGLVRLHDEMGKHARTVRKHGLDMSAENVGAILDGFRDDIATLLDENGIHMFEEPGLEFNPKRQTCSRIVPTHDTARVGLVAERLRPGFEDGRRPVQKERVAVYTQCAQAPQATAADTDVKRR